MHTQFGIKQGCIGSTSLVARLSQVHRFTWKGTNSWSNGTMPKYGKTPWAFVAMCSIVLTFVYDLVYYNLGFWEIHLIGGLDVTQPLVPLNYPSLNSKPIGS